MAIRPTPTTVIGIAIGGAVGFLLILLVLVFSLLRIKHKRLLLKTDAAGERRLSKYPGGHIIITDEDVARMPGTTAPLRRVPNESYARIAPCMSAALRVDSTPSRTLKEPAKAVTNERAKEEPMTPGKSWPLPRRLTRSNGVTFTPVRQMYSPADKKGDLTPSKCGESGSSEVPTLSQPKGPSGTAMALSDRNPGFHLFPDPTLRPKPLFHGQRSVSHGMLSGLGTRSLQPPECKGRVVPSSSHCTTERSGLSRSASPWSQDPGTVPDRPVPLLPIEGTLKRLARAKSFHEPSSRCDSETFGDSTSIPGGSRRLPRTDADLISPARSSASVNKSQGKVPEFYEQHGLQAELIGDQGEIESPDIRDTLPLPSPLALRKSKSVKIRASLTRSDSSGISKYIGYSWSPNASDTSLHRTGTQCRPTPRLAVPRSAERRKSRRAVSPSPLSSGSTSDIPACRQSKHSSTTILRTISGNGDSPGLDLWNNRPSSFATSEPFQWGPGTFSPLEESALVKADKGLPTLKSIHISSTLVVARNSRPTSGTINDREGHSPDLQRAIVSIPEPRKQPKSFRPPSATTFDPQLRAITPPPRDSSLQDDASRDCTYSPTLSMCNLYSENETADSSPISTPSHKPRHPHRFNTFFDNTDAAGWRSPTVLNSSVQLGGTLTRFNVFQFDAERNTDATTSPKGSTSPSRFPLPPHHTSHTTHTPSKSTSPIRGPRVPPSGFSPARRRSPTKRTLQSTSSRPKRGSKNLHASIMTLRRMNSEANQPSARGIVSREHKRYLSLSGNDPIGHEDGGGADNENEDNNRSRGSSEAGISPGNEESLRAPRNGRRWWRNSGAEVEYTKKLDVSPRHSVKGPRAMPFFDAGTISTPTNERDGGGLKWTLENMYDEDGFLKE
ncbi:MAG: hypothetical protein Q9163_004408 [Psora crenata]